MEQNKFEITTRTGEVISLTIYSPNFPAPALTMS